VKNILKRFKESNLFSPGTLKEIAQIIEKEAIIKDGRDAVFIYEKDIHQLREMFSNARKTENKTSSHDSGAQ
jgi:hypothetical protein